MVKKIKLGQLEQRLAKLNLSPQTVLEKFIRSSGHGGQNINKTSTTVYLKHLPTGIEVKMSKERSQHLNRFLAWRLLADKLEQKLLGEKSRKQQEIEKIRRQKRKRSKRAKEKLLEQKKRISLKKSSRKIGPQDFA